MALTKTSARLASEFLDGSGTVTLNQIEKQSSLESFDEKLKKYSHDNAILKIVIGVLLIVLALVWINDSDN